MARSNHRGAEAQRKIRRGARVAAILADIDRGWTIHALTGWHKCSAANIYAIARRHARTVAASAHGRPRLNLTLTPAGLDAIRAYELVHGLSSTLGGG